MLGYCLHTLLLPCIACKTQVAQLLSYMKLICWRLAHLPSPTLMTVMWIRPTKDTLSAMGKLIGQAGEAAKVKVRQARKSAVDGIKAIPSEDEQKRAEKHVSYMHQHCIAIYDP